ncbi:hypothetical protein [Novosphingobium guangzhouense]|uniref:hypothetical protein n=1 Tax=Novosphingobium guangzhouense TaxID=1850347 RepID=UPI0011AEF056|nr:hypothetical protein [Novosphingobium guangzhouense]
MRLIALSLSLPLLMANGFPAEKYELAAQFSGALIKGDGSLAGKALAPEASLHNWTRQSKTLDELVEHFKGCELKSIRGNFDRNINVDLSCSSEARDASIMFSGAKISEVVFGPPPGPVIVRQPVGNK